MLAKFCELVRKAKTEGPQVITRRGTEAVVVVGAEEWKRLKSAPRVDIKKVLIDDGPKFKRVRVRKNRFGLRVVEFR
jgi:prevent-host-death family protein